MLKVYKCHNGLTGTLDELIEMFDKYNINEFNEFYFSIFDPELKAVLKPYYVQRMFKQIGLE